MVRPGEKAMAIENEKVDYEDLYAFFGTATGNAEATFLDAGFQQATAFDTECGISLYRPPLPNGAYWCTPVNSRMFASTGGDGCHFSFLLVDGKWSGNSPVVMTYPSSGGHSYNAIVGENLREFLSLGVGTGYFALAELSFRTEEFLKQYPCPGEFAPSVGELQRRLLAELTRRFNLVGWRNPKVRLRQLRSRFLRLLEYSPRFYEVTEPFHSEVQDVSQHRYPDGKRRS
jgi:hypothetical protein